MYKILVAEDEPIERKVLCKTLQKQFGDTVTLLEAKNGREAFEIAAAELPQIAILDIEMPGITGLEAARQIREARINCVILFLTAYDNFSYAREAISVRALDFLLKPFDEKELVLSVESAMGLSDKLIKHHLVFDCIPAPEDPAPKVTEKTDNLRLAHVRDRILSYVEENYASDLSLQSAAQALNYSEAYFCKLFKQCFKVNFSAYLNEYRINRAKELLQTTRLNVREVSVACGYSDANYFARVFKRITGMTPTEYRIF